MIALDLVDAEDTVGLEDEIGGHLVIAAGVLLRLRHWLPEDNVRPPLPGLHVWGTALDTSAHFLPLIERRPPFALEAVLHGRYGQDQGIDSPIILLADDVRRGSGVLVQGPGTPPRSHLSSFQMFDDGADDVLADLGLSGHGRLPFGCCLGLVNDLLGGYPLFHGESREFGSRSSAECQVVGKEGFLASREGEISVSREVA